MNNIINLKDSKKDSKTKKSTKRLEPLKLYIFRYFFRAQLQQLSEGPVMIVAHTLEEAKKLITVEENDLVENSFSETGYKCTQEITLDKPMNLNKLLK